MEKILGIDLGTNSIGWALINQDIENNFGEIMKLGSRIIPMSEDILGKFDSGITESDTAKRTAFRGIRRLRERHLLRRERLHSLLVESPIYSILYAIFLFAINVFLLIF